jgi:PKD repeat protein
MARLAVVLAFASTVMTSADVRRRDAATPFPIAYTQYVCADENCLDGFTYVVTPDVATAGPADAWPTWWPDGSHVTFTRNGDVVVMDATAGTVVNLTNSASMDSFPSWSPDGQRIAFESNRDGPIALYLMDPDGSGVARLTTDNGMVIGRPTWSPDSTRLAFPCRVEGSNDDICAINADGSDLVRLTDDPARDIDPAWSPDGSTIAFASGRWLGGFRLAFMQPDGSGVAFVGSGVFAMAPAWSPDGRQIAFVSYDTYYSGFGLGLYTIRPDGTDMSFLAADARDPAWRPGSLFAAISVACSSLTCTFDAANSVGNISTYTWDFGDQTSATGSVVTHTFAVGGQHTIALTVTDASGATSTSQEVVQIDVPPNVPPNVPPVASFTVSCAETFVCVLDPSASHDPGGAIVQVHWAFGNGNLGGCSSSNGCLVLAPQVHFYQTAGTYTATLRVTDAEGATSEASRTFTLVATPAHIGDLDAAVSPGQGPWTATVTIEVHTANHNPYPGAVVTAVWDNGDIMHCGTDATGRCTVRRTRISPARAVSLTITALSSTVGGYSPAGNHDPDGGSNGTTITVSKR